MGEQAWEREFILWGGQFRREAPAPGTSQTGDEQQPGSKGPVVFPCDILIPGWARLGNRPVYSGHQSHRLYLLKRNDSSVLLWAGAEEQISEGKQKKEKEAWMGEGSICDLGPLFSSSSKSPLIFLWGAPFSTLSLGGSHRVDPTPQGLVQGPSWSPLKGMWIADKIIIPDICVRPYSVRVSL